LPRGESRDQKYLGKGRGISLYTLIANFVAVNARNIGLNEYEGHALYDMIYGNKTDIDIDMVTGDNHSLNQLNFIALDAIDVEYVPSIKNVREVADDLYSVKSPDTYTGLLRPKGKTNIDRIKSQKRGVLRVLLSLIMQENTQTNIIRKLNSHARYVRLRAALFEYNKIFKSTHVLNLINDIQLRKALRTARNRTESYHQLQGFIRKIYHGLFKGKKIIDNRVSAHAARLIANCIIAYNSIILNAVYEKMVKDSVAQEIIDEFCRISPIAWTHILFTGRYSFKKSNGAIDVAEMARWLEMHVKQHFWKAA
jgi:TnpA family transposase